MDPLTTSAASGIRARTESLELLANNIANQATAGYKADQEFYNLFRSPESLDGSGPVTGLPLVESQWTDFTQGTLSPTGNPLDLAISGEGFFMVEGSNGRLYTRNGHFGVSTGGQIETPQGFALLDEGGQPVRVDPSMAVEISADGVIAQDGQPVASIGLMEFAAPQKLNKVAGVYFKPGDGQAGPARAMSSKVHQGSLESANFSPAQSAVRLVGVMRQFEMLQKAMQLGSEMNRSAVRDVAKVNP